MSGGGVAVDLLLVRHGETPCSRAGRFCGTCGAGLIPEGARAVERLAGQLAGEALTAVVSSPARRAVETAEVLNRQLALPQGSEPRFAEMRFGDWEGLPVASLAGLAAFESWARDPVLFAPPGGESGAAVLARALAGVRALAERYPGGRVLVVSHKHVIRLVTAYALGLPLRAYRQAVPAPVGSVTALRLDQRGLHPLPPGDRWRPSLPSRHGQGGAGDRARRLRGR